MIAIPLGILMSSYRVVGAALEPMIDFIRYLPVPALVPLSIIWFGVGEELQDLPPVDRHVLPARPARRRRHAAGAARIYRDRPHARRQRPRQLMTDVAFRAMLPNMVDNLRITLGWCWTYLIIAEIVAADSGIGFVIWTARRYVKTPEVLAGILTIGIIGLVTDQLLRFAAPPRLPVSGEAAAMPATLHRLSPADEALRRRARPVDAGRRAAVARTSRKASSSSSSGRPAAARPPSCAWSAASRRRASGEIRLDGARVDGPSRERGMVFQSYSSFPWLTVLGNIRFGMQYRSDLGAAEKDRIARHYLDLVGLTPTSPTPILNRISGGMRQRVAIARTLAAGSACC